MTKGLNLKHAVDLMEMQCDAHPLLLMDIIPESYFKSSDAYDMYLLECFVYIDRKFGLEAAAKHAMYTTEEVLNVTEENLIFTMEDANTTLRDAKKMGNKAGKAVGNAAQSVRKAGDAVVDTAKDVKSGISNAAHNTKTKIVNPAAQWLKNQVDELIGDKAVKEEVITGSFWLRARRIGIKCILVAKSHLLTNALLALMPGGIIVLFARFIFFLVRISYYAKVAKNLASEELTDDQHKVAQKRCIQELMFELKMVREKIEDAKANGDKKAKYRLMRMESTLEREISRIKASQKPDEIKEYDGNEGDMGRLVSSATSHTV